MAIGRISGPLLKSNLLRDGADLAFETDLLYLDVNNSSIGIGKSNPDPAISLDVFGRINSDNSVVTPLALLGDVSISTNAILSTVGDINLTPATNLDFINLNGNVEVLGNLHATGSITADGSLTLGDENTDNITFNADVNSDILPDISDSTRYNIGSDSQTWLRGYFETIDADDLIISTEVDGRVTYVTNELQKVYVQLSGNDVAGDGNNLASAYRTIKYALSQATSGQTIEISPGVYEEEFPLEVPQGVAVVGSGLRSTTIIPTTATHFNNCFLLNGESTVQDLTVKDMFYDSVNDTGYAFSYAPGTLVTTRSPYIKDVSVINRGSVTTTTPYDPFGYAIGDAGRGIKVDGALVDRNSLEAAMLFDSITLIVPNSIGLEITNGGRVEWLNSFVYFADLGIHGYAGTDGIGGDGKTYIELNGVTGTILPGDTATFTSSDGSSVITTTVESLQDANTIVIDGRNDDFEFFDFTPDDIAFSPSGATATEIVNYDRKEFAAELRSIASANVYGDRGVLADGADVRLRLSSHDFGYIGSREKFTNDDNDVVTANEVIEANDGKVFFNSSDQYGDFRVGEYFRVNQETGEVTFDVEGFSVTASTGITVTDGINTAILSPTELQVGNLNLAGNSFTSTTGDIYIEAASDIIRVDSTTIFNGSHPINVVLDEDDLISDRDDALPTQQSVKKYIDNREADSIPLGYPEDSVWEDGAYIRFRSDDSVANAIDDLNEIINNVRRNSFVRAVDFAVVPTAIGSGKDLNITLTPDGTPNQYEIDWGDGTTPQIVDVAADGNPVTLARPYNTPNGGLFTVSVIARHTDGKLGDDSYTTGSFEFESKIDYITIYTPDPVVDFDFYRTLIGSSILTGNNLYVIEGQNLFLDNLTTNTLVGDSEFEINWGDGTAIETIIEPRNVTTVPGGVSGPRLQHTWAQGTSTGTGLDTVTLTITAMSTSDPVTIAARPSDTLQLKVYEDTPADPNGLSTKTIAFASPVGTSPLLTAGATDNTPGTTLTPGQAVSRTVLTSGTIDSTIISTYSYNADAGELAAVVNDVDDGVVVLDTNNQTGTYTSLNITAESDYNLLDATGTAVTFANSIYYPGAFKGFRARVQKAASAVNFGVNRFNLSHSLTGGTNIVEFVKDDLTATPITTAGTLTQNNAGTFRYISGIPYYNTGSPSLRFSGVTLNNFIGQTYRNTTQVVEVANGTNLESTGQSSIGTQYYNYATINNTASPFLTGGIPNADTGNGTPYALGDITVNITTSAVRTVEQLRLRAYNVNGTGNYVTNITPVQVHTASQSGISEIAIAVSDALGDGYNTDGRRIFNFASNPVNTPIFSSTGVNYYTSNPYTESADPGVQGTKEATIRLGRIEHNVNDYTNYLPSGPNRTGDTGTQYFTFAFQRTVVANFTVNITSSTGVAGFWIAAPGTAIDGSSTLNGWLDASIPYNGSGLPGAGTGGNGSNGCAATSGDVILPSTSLSGSKTLTLGTENLSNATNNVALVRIALAPGQSITSLGIS